MLEEKLRVAKNRRNRERKARMARTFQLAASAVRDLVSPPFDVLASAVEIMEGRVLPRADERATADLGGNPVKEFRLDVKHPNVINSKQMARLSKLPGVVWVQVSPSPQEPGVLTVHITQRENGETMRRRMNLMDASRKTTRAPTSDNPVINMIHQTFRLDKAGPQPEITGSREVMTESGKLEQCAWFVEGPVSSDDFRRVHVLDHVEELALQGDEGGHRMILRATMHGA